MQNEEVDRPARTRHWSMESSFRFVKARLALVADGRVRSEGRETVVSVYDNP